MGVKGTDEGVVLVFYLYKSWTRTQLVQLHILSMLKGPAFSRVQK